MALALSFSTRKARSSALCNHYISFLLLEMTWSIVNWKNQVMQYKIHYRQAMVGQGVNTEYLLVLVERCGLIIYRKYSNIRSLLNWIK